MQITITAGLSRKRVLENSGFTATANFFSDAFVASAPTTAQYRIDRIRTGDPSCSSEVTGWTTLTPATSISIPISASQNAIQSDYSRDEQRQLTVRANDGLATQAQATLRYAVENLAGTV